MPSARQLHREGMGIASNARISAENLPPFDAIHLGDTDAPSPSFFVLLLLLLSFVFLLLIGPGYERGAPDVRQISDGVKPCEQVDARTA